MTDSVPLERKEAWDVARKMSSGQLAKVCRVGANFQPKFFSALFLAILRGREFWIKRVKADVCFLGAVGDSDAFSACVVLLCANAADARLELVRACKAWYAELGYKYLVFQEPPLQENEKRLYLTHPTRMKMLAAQGFGCLSLDDGRSQNEDFKRLVELYGNNRLVCSLSGNDLGLGSEEDLSLCILPSEVRRAAKRDIGEENGGGADEGIRRSSRLANRARQIPDSNIGGENASGAQQESESTPAEEEEGRRSSRLVDEAWQKSELAPGGEETLKRVDEGVRRSSRLVAGARQKSAAAPGGEEASREDGGVRRSLRLADRSQPIPEPAKSFAKLIRRAKVSVPSIGGEDDAAAIQKPFTKLVKAKGGTLSIEEEEPNSDERGAFDDGADGEREDPSRRRGSRHESIALLLLDIQLALMLWWWLTVHEPALLEYCKTCQRVVMQNPPTTILASGSKKSTSMCSHFSVGVKSEEGRLRKLIQGVRGGEKRSAHTTDRVNEFVNNVEDAATSGAAIEDVHRIDVLVGDETTGASRIACTARCQTNGDDRRQCIPSSVELRVFLRECAERALSGWMADLRNFKDSDFKTRVLSLSPLWGARTVADVAEILPRLRKQNIDSFVDEVFPRARLVRAVSTVDG